MMRVKLPYVVSVCLTVAAVDTLPPPGQSAVGPELSCGSGELSTVTENGESLIALGSQNNIDYDRFFENYPKSQISHLELTLRQRINFC